MRFRVLAEKIFIPIFLSGGLLLVWQLAEDYLNKIRLNNNQTSLEFFLPSPKSIYYAFSDNWGNIQNAMIATMQKAIVGFIIGTLLAVFVAILYMAVPRLRQITLPISYAINSFPIVGFAPVIVLALGQGSFISIATIAGIVSYFPMLITLDGTFINTEKKYMEILEVLNASIYQKIKYVMFPLAMPAFFISLKLSIPASIIGAIIGEWMGSKNGIGNIMTISVYQLNPGLLYACLIETAVIGGTLSLVLRLLEKRLIPWKG